MVEVLEHSNLLEVGSGIICHQVNCMGVMGAGLALQIRRKWPEVFKSYKSECDLFSREPTRLLGHVQDLVVADGLVVANCYGQARPGRGCMTDYGAWDVILDKLGDICNFFSLDLHFPWCIGCGLAGGDWETMLGKIQGKFGQLDSMKVHVHRL